MSGVIVISGPSGVGKSTLLKKIFEEYGDRVAFSVSYTSRPPRPGEVDGVDYFFVGPEVFKKNIDNGVFVEWANVHGNYYGTSKEYIRKINDSGRICILDIDVQGALQVKKSGISAKYVFIAPESIEVLRERLIKRGTETLDVIELRIENAKKELTQKENYEYIIKNNDFDKAYNELERVIFQ